MKILSNKRYNQIIDRAFATHVQNSKLVNKIFSLSREMSRMDLEISKLREERDKAIAVLEGKSEGRSVKRPS